MEMLNIKNFINAKALPLDITENPKGHLITLINLTAGEKDTASESKAKQHLKDENLLKKVLLASRGFHSHNIKIPNTNRAGQVYFPPPVNPKSAPYIYSQTIKASKNFGWAANAAESKAKLFLSTEFIYQDQTTCLFQEFQKDSSDLINILFDLGLNKKSAEEIKQTCQNIVANPLPEHAEDPQLFWPIDDNCETYYAITPVPHVATFREIYQRTIKKEGEPERDYWYKTQNMLIGGTQPINAGDYVSSLAGWLRLLVSRPANIEKSEFIDLSKTAGKLKTILNLNALEESHTNFMRIYEIIESFFINNMKAPRSTLKNNIQVRNELYKVMGILMEDASVLRNYCLLGERLMKWVRKALPVIEIKYLTQVRLSTDEEEEFAENVLDKFAPHIEKAIAKDNHKRFSLHVKKLFKETVSDHLRKSYE